MGRPKKNVLADEYKTMPPRMVFVSRSSKPSYDTAYTRLKEHYLYLPDNLPFEVLDIIKVLVKHNPDVGYAIFSMVNFINTGHEVATDSKRATKKLNELASRVNPRGGGMDGLVSVWAMQASTLGAFAGEVVLNESLNDVQDIVPIDLKTIRFLYEGGEVIAYQKTKDGKLIKLNPLTFFYFNVNQEDDNPYGIPQLLTSIRPALMQTRMMESLEDILDKMSVWGQILAKVDTSKLLPLPGETPEDRVKRINKMMDELEAGLREKKSTDPIIHNEAVDLEVSSGAAANGNVEQFIKFIDQLLASGVKMQSTFLNMNDSNTETYGTVQLEIQLKNVKFIQKIIKRAIEKCYNLALRVWGINETCSITFNENRAVDRFKEAQAGLMDTQKNRMLLDDGVIDLQEYARREGYDEPKGTPNPERRPLDTTIQGGGASQNGRQRQS